MPPLPWAEALYIQVTTYDYVKTIEYTLVITMGFLSAFYLLFYLVYWLWVSVGSPTRPDWFKWPELPDLSELFSNCFKKAEEAEGFVPLVDEAAPKPPATPATPATPPSTAITTLPASSPIKNLAKDIAEEEAIKSGGRTSPYKGRSKAMFYDGPKSAVYKPADCVIL